MLSMIELECQWSMQPRQRILNDEITRGATNSACSSWAPLQVLVDGRLLSIDEARALVPHQNATTLQSPARSSARCVDDRAAGGGVRVPDELPWTT
jgi:homospermidine synthase